MAKYANVSMVERGDSNAWPFSKQEGKGVFPRGRQCKAIARDGLLDLSYDMCVCTVLYSAFTRVSGSSVVVGYCM